MPRHAVSAWRFREARLQCCLGVVSCADLLRVSERTIRGWESGETRIPYAAYKLLRVLRGGRYLAHPAWKDFVIRGDTLFTPEGHRFQAGELGWWSLLVRQARAFREVLRERDALIEGRPKAVSLTGLASAVPAPVLPEINVKHSAGRSPALGLSSSPSKENKSAFLMFHGQSGEHPISRFCDTVASAGVASAGLAPGADIPVWGICRPLAPLPHSGGRL